VAEVEVGIGAGDRGVERAGRLGDDAVGEADGTVPPAVVASPEQAGSQANGVDRAGSVRPS
jgi:hypothetical protein